MKKLPLHQRPFFARRILEIGGGHAPYAGVTHAVDKFPDDNTQRAASMVLGQGVEFRQGDLEAIPFESEPKFDFLYASHVLEHVNDPKQAVGEINRVTVRGYLETPSPLREQIACPFPFDAATDFHYFFCWADSNSNTVHVAKKSEKTLADFCDCENGKLAKGLFRLCREQGVNLEPLLPRGAKATRILFEAPLQVVLHEKLAEACRAGACAYRSATEVRAWASFPRVLVSKRFRQLKKTIQV